MRQPKDIRVLVVDDEPDLRETIAQDFQRQGYTVQIAENVGVALDKLKETGADIIVSDIRMPGATGLDLLKRVRTTIGNDSVFILMTGLMNIDLEEAYKSGADAVFAKPFNQKALVGEAIRAMKAKAFYNGKPPRTDRLPITLDVELRFTELPNNFYGKLMNISSGGFFATFDEPFPTISTKTVFKIRYKHDAIFHAIDGEGVVRWVRTQHGGVHPPGCGVEFMQLSGPNKHRVYELINAVKTGALR